MPCVSLSHLYRGRRLYRLRRAAILAARTPVEDLQLFSEFKSCFHSLRSAHQKLARLAKTAAQTQLAAQNKSMTTYAAAQTSDETAPAYLSVCSPTLLCDGDRIQIRTHRQPALPAAPATPFLFHNYFWRRPKHADFINAETQLGRLLFGPIPAGHRREFFHDRDNIWIWHENWQDLAHQSHELTVRYEVRPTGVYKRVADGSYTPLENSELANFRTAAHAYLYLIKHKLYSSAA